VGAREEAGDDGQTDGRSERERERRRRRTQRNRGKKGKERRDASLRAQISSLIIQKEGEKNRREKTKRKLRNGRKDFGVGPTWLREREAGEWGPRLVDGGAVAVCLPVWVWRVLRVAVTLVGGRGERSAWYRSMACIMVGGAAVDRDPLENTG